MAAKDQTTPILLTSDYWPEADQRVCAGEVIEVPIPAAMKLIEDGKAKRADPIGG